MKLHIGCGKKRFTGWVHVDADAKVLPDVVDDIRTLASFADGSADAIYACHVLEHVGRHEWKGVLRVWAQKLRPGGVLQVAVPDFEAAAKWYMAHGRIQDVLGLVSGGQRDERDYHQNIFDARSLQQGLEEAGFVDVRYWDWRTTDHADVDDYSQAYLPHMSKSGGGTLMSLNLQARLPESE